METTKMEEQSPEEMENKRRACLQELGQFYRAHFGKA